jgi:hypothetical protein
MKSIYYILIIIIGLFNACAYDGQDDKIAPKPVVEGYLAPDTPISIKVTREISYSSGTAAKQEPIEGLNITISNNGKIYALKSVGKGVYMADKSVKVKAGQSYDLAFDYDGKKVAATTTIPTRPQNFKQEFESISRTKLDLGSGGPPSGGGFDVDKEMKYTWTNPDNSYHLIVADTLENKPEAVIVFPKGISEKDILSRLQIEPSQGTESKLMALQFRYFGKYRIVLYKINPDYALLYKTNNTSSQNISTPPSSITNGLGIFTGVNADTLQFLVKRK